MYHEKNVKFHRKNQNAWETKNKLPHFQPFNCHSSVFMTSSASTLPSKPRSSKWSVPYIFPTKTLYTFLFSPTIMPHPSHPAPELLILISGEEKSSQRSSPCTFSHPLLLRLKQHLTSNTAKKHLTSNTVNTLSSNRNTELWLTDAHARTTAALFTHSVKHWQTPPKLYQQHQSQ
jgi:hypothetical protein